MTTLLLAVAPPRLPSAASQTAAPSQSIKFRNDAERYVWIAAEFNRRSPLSPGSSKGQLARDIAAVAFGITIVDLRSSSRKACFTDPRQKIVCIIRLLSRISLPKIAGLVGYRAHSSVLEALDKFAGEIGPLLKGGA